MPKISKTSDTFKHTFIYSISTFLQKGVGFIMLPIYAHYLGSEGYGIFGMIEVVVSIMTVIVGYGLLGGMQRFYYEKNTEEEKNTVISTAIIVTIGIVAIVALPVFLLNRQISLLAFGTKEFGLYIIISSISFFFEMTGQSASGYLLIKQQSLLFTCFSIARFLMAFSFNILFLIVLEMGVLGLLISTLISVSLYSLMLHVHALKKTGLLFSRVDAKNILKYNFPLIPGYVAGFIRNDADRVILRAFLGLSQLGTYSMLQKFSSLLVLFVVQPFLRIWTVQRFEICEEENGPFQLARMFTFQLALMLFVALIIGLEVPLILKIMTPSDFWLPGYFAFLAVSAKVMFGAYYHFNFGLIYQKITFKISIIQISAAILGVVLNLILIKYYGILGALVSANIVFLFQCILAHKMSKKYYSIPFEWGRISGLFIATFLLFILIDNIEMAKYLSSSTFILKISEKIVFIFKLLSLDQVRGGSLVRYFSSNFSLVAEGIVKLLLASSYFGVLILSGVVSLNKLLSFFKISREKNS